MKNIILTLCMFISVNVLAKQALQIEVSPGSCLRYRAIPNTDKENTPLGCIKADERDVFVVGPINNGFYEVNIPSLGLEPNQKLWMSAQFSKAVELNSETAVNDKENDGGSVAKSARVASGDRILHIGSSTLGGKFGSCSTKKLKEAGYNVNLISAGGTSARHFSGTNKRIPCSKCSLVTRGQAAASAVGKRNPSNNFTRATGKIALSNSKPLIDKALEATQADHVIISLGANYFNSGNASTSGIKLLLDRIPQSVSCTWEIPSYRGSKYSKTIIDRIASQIKSATSSRCNIVDLRKAPFANSIQKTKPNMSDSLHYKSDFACKLGTYLAEQVVMSNSSQSHTTSGNRSTTQNQ